MLLGFFFFFAFFFSITSIAAYGVTPHIKSVSTVTGQDRPRPRFPAAKESKDWLEKLSTFKKKQKQKQ